MAIYKLYNNFYISHHDRIHDSENAHVRTAFPQIKNLHEGYKEFIKRLPANNTEKVKEFAFQFLFSFINLYETPAW